MNNIIRYYNQNRKKIWRVIIILVVFYILLRLMAYLSILSSERKQNSNNGLVVSEEDDYNSTYISQNSGITGEKVGKEELKNTQTLLDEFFTYCNTQEFEKAYNMLTDRCKELLYPTLKNFKINYIDNIFEGKEKVYSFENWYKNTYYVTITESSLSTGKILAEKEAKHDYITIDNQKLNINAYIGNATINKEKDRKDIIVDIISKDTFMDYEIYNVAVKNNSQKTICLTDAKSSNDIYIEDSSGVQYGVYNHELIQNDMIIEPGFTRKLSFKFYNSYISRKEINNLTFKKLIVDYENYQNDNSKEYMYQYRISF